MCSIGAAAIGMGLFQGIAGMQQAQQEADYANAVAEQKWQQAKQVAERNNQIAEQNHQNQLRIATAKDKAKKEKFADDLEAYEAAIAAADEKSKVNVIEANRALAKASLEKRGTDAELAFEAQKAVTTMIKEQGKLLSTGKAGQSFLLQTEDSMRMLGHEMAKLDEIGFNQHQHFGLDIMDIGLDYASSEWANYNNLPGVPKSEQASLMPFKPIKEVPPPRPIKRRANMLGSIASAGSTFLSSGSALSGGESISTWF